MRRLLAGLQNEIRQFSGIAVWRFPSGAVNKELTMLTKKVMVDIKSHAERDYPNESCGIVIQSGKSQKYIPCRNIADQPKDSFAIHQEDYAAAEDSGDIIRIIHSHPGDGALPIPSDLDRASCNESGIIWGIYAYPADEYAEFEPTITPLIGRPFSLGVYDCYGLVMAWYKSQGIDLIDYRKTYEWWNKGEELFTLENIKATGFVTVTLEDARAGDVIIMQIRADVPNHSGILMPGDYLLHHMPNQLSRRIAFHGSYYYERVTGVYRHPDLKTENITSWL
ncbi:minor tail protein [Pectobacterium phage Ymer]|uniref:Minor tail protein n=2 Tax=unclassified Caudoviricetes TaxID=2788787 RepID=A0AB39ABD7_9CAUD